jgi:hypothetical protein
MTETTVKELEWFDLETRLREVIYQQLEIFNKKAREDREAHAALASNVKSIEKRLSLAEACVFGEEAGNTVLSDLKKKISDIEGSRKRDMVRFDQDIVSFKEHFKSLSFQITGTSENMKRVEGLQDELTKDITRVKDLVESHQALILHEIETINSHFKELNANYLDKGLKVEEKMNSTQTKMDEILLNLMKYDRQFEGVKKSLGDIYSTINLLKTNKLDQEVFEGERVKVDSKLQELNQDTQDAKTAFIIRDSFMDKFIPLQTVGLISDALNYCLDPFSRKRLAEFENVLLKELHSEALNVGNNPTREAAIAKILETIKHVEQRKTEILLEKPKEAVPVAIRSVESKSPVKVSKDTKYHENYVSKSDMLDVFEKFCELKVEPAMQKVKLEVIEKFDMLKKLITSCENEGMLFSQQVLREVEELKAKELKDVHNLEVIFTEIKENEGNFLMKIRKNEENIQNCSFLLVTLVENAQIDLALLAQEEEIKGNSFLKPKLEPPQKRGVALTSNNVLLPARPSLPKVPSILYRNKEFARKDLIEMKEKMLKLSWESSKTTIPWKQKEFENLVIEACQNIKAFVDESNFEASNMMNSKESLPAVISPSLRTRTPNNNRRLRIV